MGRIAAHVVCRAPFASVESVKAASDVMVPVSGNVTAVNNNIVEDPGLVNSSPEENGWFAKFEITEEPSAGDVMSAEQYDAFCAQEASEH